MPNSWKNLKITRKNKMLKHYKYVYQKLNSIQPELAHMFYYDEHIDKMEASAPPEEFIIDSSIPSEAQGD